MDKLKNKIAIITGGTKRIGYATAETFINEGAKVVITGLNNDEGKKATQKLGQNALFIQQDVSQEDTWPIVFQKTKEKFGTPNILVNNAGTGIADNAEDVDLDSWHRVLAVDLDGVMLGQKYAIKAMKEKGGSIVNISSTAGLIGIPDMISYNAAKGGVRLITKSAALYCNEKGYPIRVNSVHPGYVRTPMTDQAPEGFFDSLKAMHLRFADPKEIANLIVFLGSDDSSYSNGSEFVVDDGFTAQ